MPKSFRAVAIAFTLVACAPGCATPAEQAAEAGLASFKSCDLRAASQAFERAHNLDATRADFALAYALSTLAVLPEDPAVTAVLLRLGFTKGIDTSAYWGSGGALSQLSTHMATCQSVNDYVRSSLPYPPAQKSGPAAASAIKDPKLTGDDFVAAAAALSPQLEALSSALETAAGGAAAGTDIEGGCGVGKVHIEAPELYGLAAFIEIVRATVQAARGYDWAIPATLALETPSPEPALANALNAHILRVVIGTAVSDASPIALHAVTLFEAALGAAKRIPSRRANSLFDWSAMPPGTLADLETLAAAARAALSSPGLQALPFVTPTLQMDSLSFFRMPIDASNAQLPIWSATPWTDASGASGYTLTSSSQSIQAQVSPRFSPDPFAPGAKFMFTLPTRWQNINSAQWNAVFDPDKRWDMLYTCK